MTSQETLEALLADIQKSRQQDGWTQDDINRNWGSAVNQTFESIPREAGKAWICAHLESDRATGPEWATILDVFILSEKDRYAVDVAECAIAHARHIHPLSIEVAGIRLRQQADRWSSAGLREAYERLCQAGACEAAIRVLPTWLLALPVEEAVGIACGVIPNYGQDFDGNIGSALIDWLSRSRKLSDEQLGRVHRLICSRLVKPVSRQALLVWSLGRTTPAQDLEATVLLLLHWFEYSEDSRIAAASCQALNTLSRRFRKPVWEIVLHNAPTHDVLARLLSNVVGCG